MRKSTSATVRKRSGGTPDRRMDGLLRRLVSEVRPCANTSTKMKLSRNRSCSAVSSADGSTHDPREFSGCGHCLSCTNINDNLSNTPRDVEASESTADVINKLKTYIKILNIDGEQSERPEDGSELRQQLNDWQKLIKKKSINE
ncbi:hypothetical protein EVAR_16211_1 [Eumeta japonica]|uniref:Uncharacterized protein n=1 Tax=Eumeta variegata TaxID=151549 RepID=A0A4C1U5N6_EUMVA|nr:hypothetical protein EVAR_16211_1 [Eumeta japonica]